ncbi:MAG TPA: nascent polypeptide-associated complex protein [Thermoplasmata archaeon]|nr:nascent polypeptide-associated complex protein [Thermoplasmata archaeon]
MLGGGPRNNRQMQMMMRQLGLKTEPVEHVDEVIIRTRDQEHVFRSPEVTILTVRGVRTYQVVGDAEVRPRTGEPPAAVGPPTAAPAAPSGPPPEDIELVMEQTGVEHDEAVAALEETQGQPAEAILRILSRRGTGSG